MSIHREISFEREICEHLAAHGWLYADGDASQYDRTRALFPDDVLTWVQQTQPDAWNTLIRNDGSRAGEVLLGRLREQLDQRGTLEVLRQGIDLLGLRARLPMAQFRPALAANDEILARYAANRLRVVRQVRYSVHNENSIDLVLFLNGIPVATVELKTDFTQRVDDAVDQYRFDRPPRTAGKAPEPLLSFPGGALVHFAVSNTEVRMATRLEGAVTRFLPFNQGSDGGAGNPLNPGGHPTAYLWEHIWARDGWLEILGRYLVAERDEKKVITRVLFPRYHQLAATRQLLADVRVRGPGGRYLIQHSAGIAARPTPSPGRPTSCRSCTTKRTARCSTRCWWFPTAPSSTRSCRRPSSLRAHAGRGGDHQGRGRLQERRAGRRRSLAARRSSSAPSRPFPSHWRRCASWPPRRASASPSSPTRRTARRPARPPSSCAPCSSAAELRELGDGGEVSTEDLLAAEMAARAYADGITYVAFTATPKNRRWSCSARGRTPPRKPAPDNVPLPFHVYSMRQAIEEEFILDVLQQLHLVQNRLQAGARRAGDGRAGGGAERGDEGASWDGYGCTRTTSPRRCRSWWSISAKHVAPLLSGQRQGHGGRRQPGRGRALAAGDRQVHPPSAATASARSWPSPAR